MLKYRVLTALLLIPAVLGLLFLAPTPVFLGLGLVVLLGCSMEWTILIPTSHYKQSFLFILCFMISMVVVTQHAWLYQYIALFLWFGILVALLNFPHSQRYWGNEYSVAFSALILLPLCGYAITKIYLTPQGSALLLYLLFLVWATDTGAYFLGKYAGNHKLIPQVSPGKTIEGAVGGIICALLVSMLGYHYFHPFSSRLWFTQALLTIIFSMIGDLFISMLKRRVKCKDTGHILPGHGGLLDRLDSLIAAAPLFYLLRS